MGLIAKIVAGTFAVLIALVVIVVGAAFVVNWNEFRGYAEGAASGIIGRKVTIGHLDVSPGWTTRVTIRDLSIDSPEGIEKPFAKVERAVLSFRPWTFLENATVFNEISLEKPAVYAVREKDNRRSWNFSVPGEAATKAVKPDERTEFPTIRNLMVKDGEVIYWDKTRGLKLDGTVETIVGDSGTRGEVRIGLRGKLEGRPAEIKFTGGAFSQLHDKERPYAFNLRIDVGETVVRAKGTATEPIQMRGLNLKLFLRGPSLADVFPLFRIPMPHTPTYSIEGRLLREGSDWRFSDFTGKIGDSDLSGWISANYEQKRPLFKGELVSHNLDLRDLGGLIGGQKQKETPSPEEARFLPDTPINTERIRASDLDIKFRGAKVEGPGLPKMSLEMRIRINQGLARVQPLAVELPLGRIQGEVELDASKSPPHGRAALFVVGVELRSLLEGTRFAEETSGKLDGRASVTGRGKSFADIVGKGDGRVAITTADSRVSALLVEAVGLDIAEALAVLVSGDGPVPIRCGRIEGKMTDGLIEVGRAVIDTTDTLVVADGSIDLGKEEMTIQVEGHAKDFSLLDLSAPVVVRGPFSDLSVKVGVDPLPFLEMGEAENMNCEELLTPEK